MNIAQRIGSLLSHMPENLHLGLRPQTEADWPFLRDLFVSRRWAEACAASGWNDAQRLAFLHSQAELQQRHYAQQFASADFLLIEQHHSAIGRLCVLRAEREVRVIDIALLPDWQRQGIGSAVMRAVLYEAGDLACSLSVEAFSPARRLYERLGFRLLTEQGPYLQMHRPAGYRGARRDDTTVKHNTLTADEPITSPAAMTIP